MKQLRRSVYDRKIAGVCGGLAEYFHLDANLVRLLWIIFTFAGGSGVLAYILCWVLIPEE